MWFSSGKTIVSILHLDLISFAGIYCSFRAKLLAQLVLCVNMRHSVAWNKLAPLYFQLSLRSLQGLI